MTNRAGEREPLPCTTFQHLFNENKHPILIEMTESRSSELLSAQPCVGTGEFDRHVREKDADRLAVFHPTVFERDQQRASLLVVSPARGEGGLRVASGVVDPFSYSVVPADEEFVPVTRRIAALRRIGNNDAPGRPLPARHLLRPLVLDLSILVPGKVKRKE